MITIAQIGCGYWGPNLLRNFSIRDDCVVKWVVEIDQKRRDYVKQNYPNTITTDDYNEVLQDSGVDGVVVCTPAETHYEISLNALLANKHTLVEKPLAMDLAQVDDLGAEALSRNLILMVGDTFVFSNAVKHVKSVIDKGELGEIYYIYTQRLNLGQVRKDVNAWWNLAPHDISILLYLMDGEMPSSIIAVGRDHIQPGFEDVVFSRLVWSSGMTANIQVSWLDPGKVRKVTIVGSSRMLVYDDVSENKIQILDKGVDVLPRLGDDMEFDSHNEGSLKQRIGDIVIPRVDNIEPLSNEVGHFLKCVKSGQKPSTGIEHARSVVAILVAGQKSIKSNGTEIKIS